MQGLGGAIPDGVGNGHPLLDISLRLRDVAHGERVSAEEPKCASNPDQVAQIALDEESFGPPTGSQSYGAPARRPSSLAASNAPSSCLRRDVVTRQGEVGHQARLPFRHVAPGCPRSGARRSPAASPCRASPFSYHQVSAARRLSCSVSRRPSQVLWSGPPRCGSASSARAKHHAACASRMPSSSPCAANRSRPNSRIVSNSVKREALLHRLPGARAHGPPARPRWYDARPQHHLQFPATACAASNVNPPTKIARSRNSRCVVGWRGGHTTNQWCRGSSAAVAEDPAARHSASAGDCSSDPAAPPERIACCAPRPVR